MKAKKGLLVILTMLMMLAVLPLTTMAAPTTMWITPSSLTLEVGETYKLKVVGTAKKVKWSSSKKKVATISSKGVVTAKKAGTTVISAKVSGKTLKIKVKVVKLTGMWVVQAGAFNHQINVARQFIRVKDLVPDAYWKHKNGVYRIIAGSFYDRENALIRRNYLLYHGIEATILYE